MRVEKLKVVIAEDEPIVARYIQHILETMDGFQVAALCETGEEAVEQCIRELPQLLITDIKMPGITGLELIRRVKNQGTELAVIIISGFKNFDYAKEAISLGVESYITKPIHVEELKKTLGEIQESCRQDLSLKLQFQMERAMRNQDEAFFREHFPYARFRLLAVYQSGETEDMNYEAPWREHRLTFFHRNAWFVLDGYPDTGEEPESPQGMVKSIMLSKRRKKTCTIVLVQEIKREAESLRKLQGIYQSLRQLVIPGKMVYRECKEPRELDIAENRADESLLNQVELPIVAREWEAVAKYLGKLFIFWKENKCSLYQMRTGIHRITDRLYRAGVFTGGKIFVNEYVDDCIRFSDSYEELQESVCGYLEEALWLHRSRKQEEQTSRQLFEKICEFVFQNQDKNFSLNEISNIFGMSPPFIRKVFRGNVGMSYNEWVLQQKIERAKMLMRTNPNLKVKEVAERMGYDQLYFSTLFNKYVGMSPSEYKFRNVAES